MNDKKWSKKYKSAKIIFFSLYIRVLDCVPLKDIYRSAKKQERKIFTVSKFLPDIKKNFFLLF